VLAQTGHPVQVSAHRGGRELLFGDDRSVQSTNRPLGWPRFFEVGRTNQYRAFTSIESNRGRGDAPIQQITAIDLSTALPGAPLEQLERHLSPHRPATRRLV